jgi:hypothetical protein
LTSKLGLREGSNVYAGPAEDVQDVCTLQTITLVLLHHSGHSRQGEGAVAASRGTTALPAAFSQVINMTWFKRKENKADKRMLLETEGREEDLQLLILQNTGGWNLEGDASEQLEVLYQQRSEDKLSESMADVLALCRERWQQLKSTTRKDVFRECSAYWDKDRKPYGICDPLRARACWRARPTTRRSLSSPPNSRPVRAVRTVRYVCGVRSLRTLRTLRSPTTAATRNSSIPLMELQNENDHYPSRGSRQVRSGGYLRNYKGLFP